MVEHPTGARADRAGVCARFLGVRIFPIEIRKFRWENARHHKRMSWFLLRIFAFLLETAPDQRGFGSG